jgi:hypothetical protein
MSVFFVRCLIVAAVMGGILTGSAVPATACSTMRGVIVATMAGGTQRSTDLPMPVPGVRSLPKLGLMCPRDWLNP